MPHLATIVARLLVKSLKRYKACLELLLPALLTLVLPIQVALSALSRGTLSPADRLPAAIFALQLTVLSILTSYAFIPRTAQVLRAKPPSLRTSDLLPRKRALAAAVFLLGGLRLLLGPGRYALPAFAFVALFFAFWPWVRQHANLGSRLIKKGVRLWRQRSFSERMTIAFAFVLAQAAPLALGRAASVAVGAMGGPNLAWTIQAIMAVGLLPLHLLILITLGTKLRYSRTT